MVRNGDAEVPAQAVSFPPVLTALPGLSPVHTDPVAHHPDLAQLRRAAKAADWPAVSEYFARMPARADRSVAVRLVAETPEVERFLQKVADAERESSLARTLLGARLIVMAWKARGAYLARFVSQAQWEVFGKHLQHAERVLADATALDPTNAAAWTERITTARGLSLAVDESRRRYQRAAENCDTPYIAQAQLLQNLCPKWQGSFAEMHAFARECLADAKAGSLGGAIVANAHVEQAFTATYLHEIAEYLGQRKVRDELAAAAAHTMLHPEFQPCQGDVTAHTVFAYAFHAAGDFAQAARHFATLGSRSAGYPWQVMNGKKWKSVVRRARHETRKW